MRGKCASFQPGHAENEEEVCTRKGYSSSEGLYSPVKTGLERTLEASSVF